MSQTDLSSSIYDGDLDNFTYLSSDNVQILTPDPSISQRTEESSDPEFLQPSLPLQFLPPSIVSAPTTESCGFSIKRWSIMIG